MREIDFEVESLLTEWISTAGFMQNIMLVERTRALLDKLRATPIDGKQDQLTAHEASGY